MQGRSIRSIALDYYRKRGADIRPLDGASAFEIVQAEGQALKVTFTDEAVVDGQMTPMTATSPQWRAILEDLTADVAVSYRYLTAGPIAKPAVTLTGAMPAGYAVNAAKLLHVDHRTALGVTHRATFDSPALNACQEVIFQHLWDVQNEARVLAMEPGLYQTPAIVLRPEHMPSAETVHGLVDQSAQIVDTESEVHGARIEEELAELLAETTQRVNQYFDQQMGNVLSREVQLTEKLDAMIKKLGEAKTSEQMTRFRQDGESLRIQLDQVSGRREEDLKAVEAACLAKLESERERHELTATIDLVALCHATYDVLTYRCELTTPTGAPLTLDVRYWPVTRELAFPNCPSCAHPMEAPTALFGGGHACEHCIAACVGCGAAHDARAFVAGECATCSESVCAACVATCTGCGAGTCEAHTAECATCEAPACAGCVGEDAEGATACALHSVGVNEESPAVQDLGGHEVSTAQAEISAIYVIEAPVVAEVIEAIVDDEPVAEVIETVEEVAIAPEATAAPVAVAPTPFEMSAPAEAETLDRLVSRLNGKTLNGRVHETCHACTNDFDVAEMVNCPTCGVPACLPCTEGEMGPCPACCGLEDVESTDARLGFVMTSFPALSTRRKWAIAELGPYVVAHWKRWGRWGMVVYHAGEEPVLLTEFSHGPVETLVMTIGSWLLPGRRA